MGRRRATTEKGESGHGIEDLKPNPWASTWRCLHLSDDKDICIYKSRQSAKQMAQVNCGQTKELYNNRWKTQYSRKIRKDKLQTSGEVYP